jgi:hypothetical protein
MPALNGHIRRDNPVRAVEQTEGVLRVAGEMPAASESPTMNASMRCSRTR